MSVNTYGKFTEAFPLKLLTLEQVLPADINRSKWLFAGRLHSGQYDIGADRDPEGVLAHEGNFDKNPDDREPRQKEREHI